MVGQRFNGRGPTRLLSSFAAAVTLAGGVHADPPGSRMPEWSFEGTARPVHRFSDYAGRVAIVVYEDRDGAHQNDPLKAELSTRARAATVPSNVTLIPIANLDGYNFWPAAGYARDAVRDAARTFGVEILIDWDGSLARWLTLGGGRSHVMIVAPDRSIVYRFAGPMNGPERHRFFEVLERTAGVR